MRSLRLRCALGERGHSGDAGLWHLMVVVTEQICGEREAHMVAVSGRVQCVQLARTAQRHDEQQAAQSATEHGRGDHTATGEGRRTVKFVRAVLAIVRAIAHPLLVHTAAIVAQESAIVRVAEPLVTVHLVRLVNALVITIASVLQSIAEYVIVTTELIGLACATTTLVLAIVAIPHVVARLIGRIAVELVDRVAWQLVLDAKAFYLIGEIEAHHLFVCGCTCWLLLLLVGCTLGLSVKDDEYVARFGVECARIETLLEIVLSRGKSSQERR